MSLPHNFHLVYNSIALLPVPVLFLSCTSGRNYYRSHFFRAPAIRQAGMARAADPECVSASTTLVGLASERVGWS